MRSIGIIGFGSFGQFMVSHLKPFFDVFVTDEVNLQKDAEQLGVVWDSIENIVTKDIVVFCVPVQYLESILIKYGHNISPSALVTDVSSVKVKPIELMKKYVPESTEIIGIHPLFGPQSGKNGIEGLNIVVCPARTNKPHLLNRFFRSVLKLNVMERTAEKHDKQMAYVQALTHFVGRAVNEMDIPDVDQKTPAYQYLLDIKRNLGGDSYDLFLTIEKENPFAREVREEFIKELGSLNDELNQN